MKKRKKEKLNIKQITSKVKDDENHIQIFYQDKKGSVILSQMGTISTKRLSRKLTRLDKNQFEEVLEKIKQNLV